MPSFIYAICDTSHTPGSQTPALPAWKLEIQGTDTIEQTLNANAHLFPVGHTIVTCSDRKATLYTTAPQLTEVKGK